jgi:hypothetical protein
MKERQSLNRCSPQRETPSRVERYGVVGLIALAVMGSLVCTDAMAQDRDALGSVIRIEIDAFGADSGKITFSELALGSINPIFSAQAYGGQPDGVMVGFAGYFEGQSIGTRATCPPGAVPSGCVIGRPSAPLRLAADAPPVMIVEDGANPTSPSLSGSPIFNGPVSFVFDRDIAGIGLAGGYFNSIGGTAIQAFDREGNLLGAVLNVRNGMDYLALVTEDGSDRIAGVQFSVVGQEDAGFAIDDVSFAKSGQLNRDKIEGIRPVPDASVQKDWPPNTQLFRTIE